MKAIIINIGDSRFLLPGSHTDYEFPAYIAEHKALILRYIECSQQLLDALAADPAGEDCEQATIRARFLRRELAEFKERTGIVGMPFDSRDVDLFVTDRDIDVHTTLTL